VSSLPRKRAAGLLALVALLATAVAAVADFTTTGSGIASASVGTLSAPTLNTPSTGPGTVGLSWSTVTPPAGSTAVKYYVTLSGGTVAGNCQGSAAAATTATSCTDSGLAKGSYSYTVTATWQSWTATSAPASAVVASGAATTLVVSGYPSPTTAGASQTFTVTAKDASGNTVTGYSGTVHFTSTDAQAVLPANYTFTGSGTGKDNGAHTFSATLKTAGSRSITATDTGTGTITGTQSAITVNPASASTLAVAGYPTSTTAGVSHSFTVTAQDTFGNTATGYTGAIHITSSDAAATLPADYTFTTGTGNDNGTHTFNATLATAGTQSITATDKTTSSITGSESSIVVSAGAAASIAVSAGNNQSAPVSTAFGTALAAIVKDSSGNPVSGATVTFTAPASGASGTFANSTTTTTATTNGSGTATATTFTANSTGGSYTVTASVTGVGTPASFSLTNTGGTATKLVLSAASNNPTAGAVDNLTITAEDAANNTVSSYTGDKLLTFSGASASPGPIATTPTVVDKNGSAVNFGSSTTVTFAAGIASVASGKNGVMKLYNAGSTPSIKVSDGTINNNTSPLSVFVNSAGVTVGYSSACPLTVPKNGSATFSIAIPNDAYGNVFTTQTAQTFGLSTTNTANFGFNAVGTATASLNVGTGPANNGFTIAESGGSKTTTLTMPTVPSGFTAPGSCTVNSSS
jgi:hypothetical protein